jgi:hypothetical protein
MLGQLGHADPEAALGTCSEGAAIGGGLELAVAGWGSGKSASD